MEQSTIELWQIVVGFILPVAIATLNRRRWSSTTKGLMAFALCALVALIGTYVAGDLDNLGDPVRAFLVVFVAAIGTYHLWWKSSGIAPKIEEVTG